MGSTPVFALAGVLRKNTPASLIITRFPETALYLELSRTPNFYLTDANLATD